MKNFLEKLFGPKPIQDALLDTRSQADKDKDFLDIEFAYGADEYDWKEEKELVEAPFYPHNQWTSLSCVALAVVIWLEEFWARVGQVVISSRKDAYFWRFNKPAGGMSADDIIRIARRGVALESQVPSQGLNEAQMNTPYTVTKEILETREKNKIKAGVYIRNFTNIDDIAKASRYSPVSIFVYFDTPTQNQEWWTVFPKVVVNNLDLFGSRTSRHHISVASSEAYKVLGGVLINGVKHLKIQDSAGVGTGTGKNKNIRYVSEDFIKRRNYTAFYAIPEDSMIKANPPKEKIVWTGTRTLRTGSVGEDVKKYQQILQLEGCFDFPNPTGYFGGATRAGTIKLQNKYPNEILKPAGLKSGTGIVAGITNAFLRNKYKA